MRACSPTSDARQVQPVGAAAEVEAVGFDVVGGVVAAVLVQQRGDALDFLSPPVDADTACGVEQLGFDRREVGFDPRVGGVGHDAGLFPADLTRGRGRRRSRATSGGVSWRRSRVTGRHPPAVPPPCASHWLVDRPTSRSHVPRASNSASIRASTASSPRRRAITSRTPAINSSSVNDRTSSNPTESNICSYSTNRV